MEDGKRRMAVKKERSYVNCTKKYCKDCLKQYDLAKTRSIVCLTCYLKLCPECMVKHRSMGHKVYSKKETLKSMERRRRKKVQVG